MRGLRVWAKRAKQAKREKRAKLAKRRTQLAILAAALGFASWSVWGGANVGNVGGVWNVGAVATARETAGTNRQIVPEPKDGKLESPTGLKAFIVGADDYRDATDLPCVRNDVEAFAARLIEVGFEEKNVAVLKTGGKFDDFPTKANVEERFEAFVENLRPGDFVVVYLSGHGVQPTDSKEAFFVPVDAKAEDPFGTSVSIDRMLAALDASQARFRWMIVDACRNDPTNARGIFKTRATGARGLSEIADAPKTTSLLQSCQPGKCSYEGGEGVANGVFTLSLLEAFDPKNSRADVDGDGALAFSEVLKYVSERTNELALELHGVSQKPMLSGEITDFAILDGLRVGPSGGGSGGAGGGSGWLPFALLTLTGGMVGFAVWTERKRRRTAEALAAATSGANVSGVATGPANATQSAVATPEAPSVWRPSAGGSSWDDVAEDPSRKAWEEAEARVEAERRAREEAERKIREAERKAKEAEARAASERKAREAAERADAERRAREETERQVREAERRAQEAAARAESERKAREAAENERKAREEAERQAREAELKAQEAAARAESERKAREAAENERKAREAERRAQEAEARAASERKAREAEERAAAERRAREEAERKAKEAEARAEAERKAREEAKRKASVAARTSNGWSAEHRAGTRQTLQIKGVEYAFRYCPAGAFTMGEGSGAHKVTLTNGFWMLETPVTQAMWQATMGSNPSWFSSSGVGSSDVRGMDTSNFPVETVSWIDCQNFIKKLNSQGLALDGFKFRLPSEAEWEYACRAGATTSYFWGDSLNGDKANCDGNYPCGTRTKGQYLERTTKVGSYAANPWGLYDMHGNVWEWCEDLYTAYKNIKTFQNPINVTTGSNRVLRGGSWDDGAGYCRSAERGRNVPASRSNGCGFRLALVRPSSSSK